MGALSHCATSSGFIYAVVVAVFYREWALRDAALGRLVEGTIFTGRVYRFRSIDSTNSALLADAALKDAAGASLAEGTIYLRDEQHAGSGSGGHIWHCASGVGLYLSVLLRPNLPPDEVLGITLAAGIAAAEAISQVAGVDCDVHWPNDLLVQEKNDLAKNAQAKKAGGILTEMNSSNGGAVIVGFGINVNHTSLPPEVQESATSLFLASGTRIDAAALTVALLQFFDREYRQLVQKGLRALLPRFEQHSSYVRGQRVVVGEESGYEGITNGLDERGFLRVKTAEGIRTVLSGSVRAVSG